MPQDYFQLKQFRVDQSFAGLKVTTDACLFGAWVDIDTGQSILDIGTGTGLLSLMAAQQSPTAKIYAIEVNEVACTQAKQNIENSPWNSRIELLHISVQEFAEHGLHKFDMIIANPPFFSGQMKSSAQAKSEALHSDLLPPYDLALSIDKLLAANGKAYVLYPAFEAGLFEQNAAKFGLYVNRICEVYNTPSGNVFRRMLCLTKIKSEAIKEKLYIRDGSGEYSSQFKSLLKPYYLHF